MVPLLVFEGRGCFRVYCKPYIYIPTSKLYGDLEERAFGIASTEYEKAENSRSEETGRVPDDYKLLDHYV